MKLAPAASRRFALGIGALGIGAVAPANAEASVFSLAVPLLYRGFPAPRVSELGLVQTATGSGSPPRSLPLTGSLTDTVPAHLLGGLGVFTTAPTCSGSAWSVCLG